VIIERDEETKKIQASIKAGMSANASHLQSYLSTWDRYQPYTVHVLPLKRNIQISLCPGHSNVQSVKGKKITKKDLLINKHYTLNGCFNAF